MSRIANWSELILKVLNENEESRDNDELLSWEVISRLAFHDDHATHVDVYPLRAYLSRVHKGTLPPIDTITRLRRQLQEQHPTVRGKRWFERHNKRTKIYQEKLGYST